MAEAQVDDRAAGVRNAKLLGEIEQRDRDSLEPRLAGTRRVLYY
jgi:hypothetical protein